ncbi:putative oxidoreductase GLYR1 [Chionoecetes opilio]|uniref:Putative oxidoreductase GLYR1 n=1 Tax=Chionoecetes opilio TaxID=41210 RepID=A0A8J4YSF8_CHIOP|nr:putative oxidoreductase GLYR1 [Chionoecetes opilio]
MFQDPKYTPAIKHIMEDCTAHNHTGHQHNILSMKALWESPVQAMAFLRLSGQVPAEKDEKSAANHTEKSITPSKEKKVKVKTTTSKRRPNSDTSSGGGSAKRIKTEPLRLKDSILDTSPSSHNAKARVSALLNRPVHIERPETPPLDIGSVSQTLKDKKIEPSGLKFGFLGLGIIGSGIVKNLLNSGHSVMVWNRSSEKSCLV